MRTLLLILILLNLLAVTGFAKIYSCRDKSGQLHYADNLQGLPEECLGQTKEVKKGPIDNLNYVPEIPNPRASSGEFQHNVRDVERGVQQKKIRSQQLSKRAEVLLDRYQQANADKYKARRAWDNSSRGKIKLAEEQLVKIRAGKQQLLEEIEQVKLSRGIKVEISEILSKIDFE